MKDFLQMVRERYSVRDFQQRPIEDADMSAILEAGRLAPTAVNYQPQRIYVIKSREGLEKIRSLTPCAFNAPVVLLVCADVDASFHSDFDKGYNSGEMDAAIVGTHMMLAAADRGVGSTWVLWFTPGEIKEAFGLPDHIRPMFLLPMGYPGEGAAPSDMHGSRKPLSETVFSL